MKTLPTPSPTGAPDIARNIATLRVRAGAARLMAVSKAQGVEAIRTALVSGQRLFGENRVQEAEKKFPALRQEFSNLELHLIGALQTNKAEDAVRLFDVIETLDRPRLADALARAVEKMKRTPRFYIEVNVGGEDQKSGVAVENVESFLTYCRSVCGLTVEGLMCIPPQDKDPEPFFRLMKKLADQFQLPHLSMGMSGDFEKAVACGSTQVRIGTALFGARPHAAH